MTMYRCEDCGHLFECGEESTWEESRGEHFGTPCTEKMAGCPICKGDYEEVKPCLACGSYEHDADEVYCENCKNEVKKRFLHLIESNFTKEERELLNELYDGERI